MAPFLCPICESSLHQNILPYRCESTVFANSQIFICAKCNAGSMFPMINDSTLSSYYETYWKKNELDTVMMDLFVKQAKARHIYIKPYLQKAGRLRVLDIGAGFGLIRREFSDDTNYEAIEVDPDARKFLKNTIKASAIWTDVKECQGVYNLIILSHIIEHIPQPVEYLKRQINMLADKGIFFIEVPNMDYRYKVRNEPHIIFFNPDSIKNLVQKIGLKVYAINSCGFEIEQLERQSSLHVGDNTSVQETLSMSTRKIAKKILPSSFYQFIKIMKAKHINNKCFEYGTHRQWIRLIAGFE